MPEWQEWPEVGRKVYLRPKRKKINKKLVREVWTSLTAIVLFIALLCGCTVEQDNRYIIPTFILLGIAWFMTCVKK